jgi:hypothetical protein
VRVTRDNVGLICRLVPKTEVNRGVKLVVGTTHILFNQRRRDIKLAQMSVFLAGRGGEKIFCGFFFVGKFLLQERNIFPGFSRSF